MERIRTPSDQSARAPSSITFEQRLHRRCTKSILSKAEDTRQEFRNTRGFLSGSTIDHRINRRAKAQALRLRVLFADPQTDVASGVTRSRNMRSRCRCSMCPAIHINSRSWLRSSSTHEPSDPPLRVISFSFRFQTPSWLRYKEKGVRVDHRPATNKTDRPPVYIDEQRGESTHHPKPIAVDNFGIRKKTFVAAEWVVGGGEPLAPSLDLA